MGNMESSVTSLRQLAKPVAKSFGKRQAPDDSPDMKAAKNGFYDGTRSHDREPPSKRRRLGPDAAKTGASPPRKQRKRARSNANDVSTTAKPAAMSADEFEQGLKDAFQLSLGNEMLRMHQQHQHLELEIAKAQTMLEQIRRCRVVPYPGWDGISQQVIRGAEETGPLVERRGGYHWPEYAAPRMIPDGPYTRHYTRWLIPDPRFAPTVIAEQHELRSYGRSTRNSNLGSFDWTAISSEAVPLRPAQPELDPMVTRNSNGEWCRLSCPHEKCQGVIFRSIQGLINHSRISHQDKYLSHAQCADNCGTPVELDEETIRAHEALHTKNKPGQSRMVPAKSAMNYDRISGVIASPNEVVNFVSPAPKDARSAEELSRLSLANGIHSPTVHPFNLHGSGLPTGPQSTVEGSNGAPTETSSQTDTPKEVRRESWFRSFTGCPSLPNLSQRLKWRTSGNGDKDLDLQKMTEEANEAKKRSQLEPDTEEEEDEVVPSPQQAQPSPKTKSKSKASPKSKTDLRRARSTANANRVRKPAGNRPRVSRMGLPASSPGPHTSSSKPNNRSLVLNLDDDSSTQADLQSPDLPSNPGLVSDRESLGDEEDEDEEAPPDYKPASSNGGMDVDIEYGDERDHHLREHHRGEHHDDEGVVVKGPGRRRTGGRGAKT